MAGITLVQAEAQLALYLAAEAKILKGQAVEMDGKRLTRADLSAVQAGVKLWDSRAKSLANSGGKIRMRQVIPL